MAELAATVRDNLSRLAERVERAAVAAGRPADTIRLVGVTKYVDVAAAAALCAAGCRALGESRPQELWAKAESPELAGVEWHLIGHLQRNKVRRTLPYVDWIQSVDSLRLLAAIDEEAARLNKLVRVLLEVNCSGEAVKHGVMPDELPGLLEAAGNCTHLQVRGLMTMAPGTGGLPAAGRSFAALRTLRDRVQPAVRPTVPLDELSMGMSGDFEVAIQEGATIIRVGSALWEGVIRKP